MEREAVNKSFWGWVPGELCVAKSHRITITVHQDWKHHLLQVTNGYAWMWFLRSSSQCKTLSAAFSLNPTMAAAVSSPCSTPLMTQKPSLRVDFRHGFLKSFDFGHQKPIKWKTFHLKELVVSASTDNAVSVTDPVPSLTRSK